MEKKLLNLLLSIPQEQNVIHMGPKKKKPFDLEGFEPTKTLFFTLCGPISILGQSTQWEIKGLEPFFFFRDKIQGSS